MLATGAREVGIEVGANRSEYRSAFGNEWKSIAAQCRAASTLLRPRSTWSRWRRTSDTSGTCI